MTYPVLALITVVAPAVIAVIAYQYAARRQAVPRRFWVAVGLSIVVLCTLTVIFDSLMISADLFRYDTDKLSGITLWKAPLEDLGWPIAAGLAGPCLLIALDARRTTRRPTSGTAVTTRHGDKTSTPTTDTHVASPPPSEGPQ